MKTNTRLIRSGITWTAAAVLFSFAAFGAGRREVMQKGEPTRNEAQSMSKNADNPLIEEMRVLDAVFRDVVSGVAVGDGRRVHAAIERMHGKMEKTQEGIRHGKVKLKKNAARLGEFAKQDSEFHAMLEVLAEAALKNDGSVMLSSTKKLLDACFRCHSDFRKS